MGWCKSHPNKKGNKMKFTEEITNALRDGLKFSPSFFTDNKQIKSKALNEYNKTYNKNYVLIKTNNQSFPFLIVNGDNPYRVDSFKYYSYRLGFKVVEEFTSRYHLNKWLGC